MLNNTYDVSGSPYHIPDYAEDYREPTEEQIQALARKAELSDPFGIDADTYRKVG